MIATDADIDGIATDIVRLLNFEYRTFGDVSDGMMKLVDSLVSLIITTRVRFDTEFTTILYTWEYDHCEKVV